MLKIQANREELLKAAVPKNLIAVQMKVDVKQPINKLIKLKFKKFIEQFKFVVTSINDSRAKKASKKPNLKLNLAQNNQTALTSTPKLIIDNFLFSPQASKANEKPRPQTNRVVQRPQSEYQRSKPTYNKSSRISYKKLDYNIKAESVLKDYIRSGIDLRKKHSQSNKPNSTLNRNPQVKEINLTEANANDPKSPSAFKDFFSSVKGKFMDETLEKFGKVNRKSDKQKLMEVKNQTVSKIEKNKNRKRQIEEKIDNIIMDKVKRIMKTQSNKETYSEPTGLHALGALMSKKNKQYPNVEPISGDAFHYTGKKSNCQDRLYQQTPQLKEIKNDKQARELSKSYPLSSIATAEYEGQVIRYAIISNFSIHPVKSGKSKSIFECLLTKSCRGDLIVGGHSIRHKLFNPYEYQKCNRKSTNFKTDNSSTCASSKGVMIQDLQVDTIDMYKKFDLSRHQKIFKLPDSDYVRYICQDCQDDLLSSIFIISKHTPTSKTDFHCLDCGGYVSLSAWRVIHHCVEKSTGNQNFYDNVFSVDFSKNELDNDQKQDIVEEKTEVAS